MAGLAAAWGVALAGGGCMQDDAMAPQEMQPTASPAVVAPAEAQRSASAAQGPNDPRDRPRQTALAPDRPAPPPPAPPQQRADRAPVPDRELSAPRGTDGGEQPRVGLGFIHPRSTVHGSTFDDDQFQRQRDWLFEQPAPGATLRIPFSY